MKIRVRTFVLAYCGLLVSAACRGAKDTQHLLKPGVGVGNLRLRAQLGRSALAAEAAKNQYARDGVWYSSDESGAVSEIMVTSPAYVTDRAIRVGSTTEEVRVAYGPGVEKQMTISQGGLPIGKLGDVVLEYSGVVFVVSRERVAAIRLVNPPGQ